MADGADGASVGVDAAVAVALAERPPTEQTAASGSQQQTSAQANEHGGPFGALRARFINLRTLNWPLRIAVALAVAQAIVVSVLLLRHDPQQPGIVDGSFEGATLYIVPFAVSVALRVLAWSFALTGAIHSSRGLRAGAFAAFAFAIGNSLLAGIELTTGGFSDGIALSQAVFVRYTLATLAALAVIVAWALAVSLLRRRAARVSKPLPRSLPGVTFAVVLAALAAYYVLYFFFNHYVYGGPPDEALANFAFNVIRDVEMAAGLFLPVIVLAGTDFTEWGEAVAGGLTGLLARGRSIWPLVVAAALVVGAVLALWHSHYALIAPGAFVLWPLVSFGDVVAALVVATVATALFLGVERLGRVAVTARPSVPYWALILAVLAALGADWLQGLLSNLNSNVLDLYSLPFKGAMSGVLDALSRWLIGLMYAALGLKPSLFFGLAVGIPLLWRGRRRGGAMSVAGLFLVVFAVYDGILREGILVIETPFRSFAANWPALWLPNLQNVVALATVGVLLWLVIRRPGAARSRALLAPFFMLDVGLVVVGLVNRFYGTSPSPDATATRMTISGAVFLVGAFVWDLLTSGEQITNRDSASTPRYARVLLYLGYSMLATVVVLNSAVQGLPTPQATLQTTFEWGSDALAGLMRVGVPLLLTLFVLRLRMALTPVAPASAGATPEGEHG